MPKSNSFFTPAEFAKTKFGSTKSKNNFVTSAKSKPKVVANTQNNEFSAYIKQKLQQQTVKKSNFFDQESYQMENTSLSQQQIAASLLFSNLSKSTSFTSGYSGSFFNSNPIYENNGHFDFLVNSTIRSMIENYDDDETNTEFNSE